MRYAYDMVLWAYVGGWVGARLFVIPAGWNYFVDDPIAFLLSGSGWVWYGGLDRRRRGRAVVGAHASASPRWWSMRHRRPGAGDRVSRSGASAASSPAMATTACPPTLPWGMSYPDGVVPTTERVHPTPLYELVLYVAIFIALWRQRGRGLPAGHLFGQYLIYTGAARFAVEFLRRNPAWLLGLTTAQWFSLASVAFGVYVLRRVGAVTSPRGAQRRPLDAAAHQPWHDRLGDVARRDRARIGDLVLAGGERAR